MFRGSSLWFAFIPGALLLGCSGTDNTSSPNTSGGNSGVGGASSAIGGAGTGGAPTFGGSGVTGGTLSTER
jgi:hypothetical protein